KQLTDGDALLRLHGGTPAFVDKLIEGIDIHSSSEITLVEEQGEGVLVKNAQGEQFQFDRVVVATPTNKLDSFLNVEQF
ncbi:monoamine oxidase, partial [Staphylococcus warneri]